MCVCVSVFAEQGEMDPEIQSTTSWGALFLGQKEKLFFAQGVLRPLKICPTLFPRRLSFPNLHKGTGKANSSPESTYVLFKTAEINP